MQEDEKKLNDVDLELQATLEALEDYYNYHRIELYYPDEDSTYMGRSYPARSRYARYLQFFAAGIECLERAAFCGNQIGKSESLAGYETALHLTGRYPKWWKGHRFEHPIYALCAGKSAQSTRDLVQNKLFGDESISSSGEKSAAFGTGLIPKDDIVSFNFRTGVAPGSIDTAWIRHASSKTQLSKITFRTSTQGREAAEGHVLHWSWTDEEPGADFYRELKRGLLNTNGKMVTSFTPLDGITDTVVHLLGAEGKVPPYDPNLYNDLVQEMLKGSTVYVNQFQA